MAASQSDAAHSDAAQRDATQPEGFEYAKSKSQEAFLLDFDSKLHQFSNSSSILDKVEAFGAVLQKSVKCRFQAGTSEEYRQTIFRQSTEALQEVSDAIRKHLSQPVPIVESMLKEPPKPGDGATELNIRVRINVAKRMRIMEVDMVPLKDEMKGHPPRVEAGITVLRTACGAEEWPRYNQMVRGIDREIFTEPKVEALQVQDLKDDMSLEILFGHATLALMYMAKCLSGSYGGWEVQHWDYIVVGK